MGGGVGGMGGGREGGLNELYCRVWVDGKEEK